MAFSDSAQSDPRVPFKQTFHRTVGQKDRAEILASACALLDEKDFVSERTLLVAEYPCPGASTRRKPWSLRRLVAVFIRDGFTDRYFGTLLVFPRTLRALSLLAGEAFPYDRNWKQSANHPAFWELYPTIDHVVPVARGGADNESNVVTTSVVRNSAKSNWLLEEIGWPSVRAPTADGWDGLRAWFTSAWGAHDSLRANTFLRAWHRASRDANGA